MEFFTHGVVSQILLGRKVNKGLEEKERIVRHTMYGYASISLFVVILATFYGYFAPQGNEILVHSNRALDLTTQLNLVYHVSPENTTFLNNLQEILKNASHGTLDSQEPKPQNIAWHSSITRVACEMNNLHPSKGGQETCERMAQYDLLIAEFVDDDVLDENETLLVRFLARGYVPDDVFESLSEHDKLATLNYHEKVAELLQELMDANDESHRLALMINTELVKIKDRLCQDLLYTSTASYLKSYGIPAPLIHGVLGHFGIPALLTSIWIPSFVLDYRIQKHKFELRGADEFTWTKFILRNIFFDGFTHLPMLTTIAMSWVFAPYTTPFMKYALIRMKAKRLELIKARRTNSFAYTALNIAYCTLKYRVFGLHVVWALWMTNMIGFSIAVFGARLGLGLAEPMRFMAIELERGGKTWALFWAKLASFKLACLLLVALAILLFIWHYGKLARCGNDSDPKALDAINKLWELKRKYQPWVPRLIMLINWTLSFWSVLQTIAPVLKTINRSRIGGSDLATTGFFHVLLELCQPLMGLEAFVPPILRDSVLSQGFN